MTDSAPPPARVARRRALLAVAVALVGVIAALALTLTIRAGSDGSTASSTSDAAPEARTATPRSSESGESPSPSEPGDPTSSPATSSIPGTRPTSSAKGTAPVPPGSGETTRRPSPLPPPPAAPVQTIELTVPGRTFDSERIRLNGDRSIVINWSLLTFEPAPVAVETGLPVAITPTSDACALAGSGVISVQGSIGSTCVLRVQVPGTDSYAPFDALLSIQLESLGHVSWQVTAEPDWPGCYVPGGLIGSIELEATGTTVSLGSVDVLEIAPGLIAVPAWSQDAKRMSVSLSVASNATLERHKVVIGFENRGQTLSTQDRPTERVYDVRESCG